MRRRSSKQQAKLDGAKRRRWNYAMRHGTCLRCGYLSSVAPEATDLHHILGGSYSRPEYTWNYAMLCRDCHRLRHDGGAVNVRVVTEQIIAAKRALREWNAAAAARYGWRAAP